MSPDTAGRLWLPHAVRVQLLAEARRMAPLETGGLLLGYRVDSDVVVTLATLPGPAAVHQERRYLPDDDHDAEQLACIYKKTGRGVDYLGDWHTHPAAAPHTSRRDRRTLRRIARSNDARAPNPVMVIIGVDEEEDWSAMAWMLTPGWWHWRVEALKIRAFSES